jgi:hypothetical protein
MVSGQVQAPAALPQGKSPKYPLDKRLGGPLSRSGRYGVEQIIVLVRNRTPAVQSMARRYTD